ncbi:MAG: helix-turn-helix domain-containing protein [Spirochaetaceae bacterium]|nr:helix-turn-helix domain-containing protein [Spirochaetaceae bacterium]
MTQEDLATMAGTSRPTVNRVLRGMEDAGVLRLGRGRIEVLDVAALRQRATSSAPK